MPSPSSSSSHLTGEPHVVAVASPRAGGGGSIGGQGPSAPAMGLQIAAGGLGELEPEGVGPVPGKRRRRRLLWCVRIAVELEREYDSEEEGGVPGEERTENTSVFRRLVFF